MKEFLIGMGIGFVVGAVMVKSNKELSKAVEKGKQMVEEKVELIEENITKSKKPAPKKQAN